MLKITKKSIRIGTEYHHIYIRHGRIFYVAIRRGTHYHVLFER